MSSAPTKKYGVAAIAVNVLASMIGLGVLTFPSSAAGSGLILYGCCMVVAVTSLVVSLMVFYKVVLHTECKTLQDTVEFTVGSSASIVTQVLFCVTGVLVTASYIIVATDSFRKYSAISDELSRFVTTLLVAAAMLPACLPTQLGSLRYISTLANIAILTIVIAVIRDWVEAEEANPPPNGTIHHRERVSWEPVSEKQSLEVAPLMIGAFACHINSVRGMNELESKSDFPKMIAYVVAIGVVAYIVFTVAGLAAYGADVADDIQNSLSGWTGSVSRTLMGVASILKAPLMVQPMRQMFGQLSGLPSEDMRLKLPLTVGLLALCSATAYAITSLSEAVALLGGTSGVAFAQLIPGAVALRFAGTLRQHQGLPAAEAQPEADGGAGDVAGHPAVQNGARSINVGSDDGGDDCAAVTEADPLVGGGNNGKIALEGTSFTLDPAALEESAASFVVAGWFLLSTGFLVLISMVISVFLKDSDSSSSGSGSADNATSALAEYIF